MYGRGWPELIQFERSSDGICCCFHSSLPAGRRILHWVRSEEGRRGRRRIGSHFNYAHVTYTHAQTQRNAQRSSVRETETDRQTKTETHRDIDRDRQADTETETDTHKEGGGITCARARDIPVDHLKGLTGCLPTVLCQGPPLCLP